MFDIDKRILNIFVIVILSIITFFWTFWIFHLPIEWGIIASVSSIRIIASIIILKDYSLSWSKVTQ